MTEAIAAEATCGPLTKAERMRRVRQRKKNGLRCLQIEVRDTEITALIAQGDLAAEQCRDLVAVKEALYLLLERVLPPATVARNG